MSPESAARSLVRRVREQPWALATGVIAGEERHHDVDAGVDPVSQLSLFEIGSITKTMTGVLTAESWVRGEATPETTLAEVLGATGPGGGLTLEDLATQRHGLPRLPPNLESSRLDETNPYAHYTAEELVEGLASIEAPKVGTYGYSNFAFMLLGLALARLADELYPSLVRNRIFEPLGMSDAVCGPPDESADMLRLVGQPPCPRLDKSVAGSRRR